MSPEHPQSNPDNINAELAFVQQALAAADRSERTSRLIVGVLTVLAVAAFIWMHLRMFPLETLGGLLHPSGSRQHPSALNLSQTKVSREACLLFMAPTQIEMRSLTGSGRWSAIHKHGGVRTAA